MGRVNKVASSRDDARRTLFASIFRDASRLAYFLAAYLLLLLKERTVALALVQESS